MPYAVSTIADNVLETVHKLVQDVIAPDVRELKVRVESLEKRMDDRFKQVDRQFEAAAERFDSFEKQLGSLEKGIDERFKAMEQMNANNFERVLSAIQEGKSLGELAAVREMAPLCERIAVLEERVRSAAA